MEKLFTDKMLQVVTDELDAVHQDMKELDRMYLNKQKQARQLKKAKHELETAARMSEFSTEQYLENE